MAPGHRCWAVADKVVGDTTPTDASNVSALGNTAGVVCYKISNASVQTLQTWLGHLYRWPDIHETCILASCPRPYKLNQEFLTRKEYSLCKRLSHISPKLWVNFQIKLQMSATPFNTDNMQNYCSSLSTCVYVYKTSLNNITNLLN